MIVVKRYMAGYPQTKIDFYNHYVYQKIADKLDDIFKNERKCYYESVVTGCGGCSHR